MRVLIVLAAAGLLALGCGCTKIPNSEHKSVPPPSDAPLLTEELRTELGLPLPDVLTLATSEDIANANTLSSDVLEVIDTYIKKEHHGVEWEVSAARDLRGCMLLWLNFPKIADGGVDIIYSKEKRAIVGTFLGGYRG